MIKVDDIYGDCSFTKKVLRKGLTTAKPDKVLLKLSLSIRSLILNSIYGFINMMKLGVVIFLQSQILFIVTPKKLHKQIKNTVRTLNKMKINLNNYIKSNP
jgi:hypothetical protein